MLSLALLIAAAAPVSPPVAPPPAERRVMLTGFDRLRVDGPFTVRVATSTGAGARISGDARATDMVQLRVEGTTLVVSPTRDDRMRPGAQPSGAPLVVALTTPSLRGVAVVGGGAVTVGRMAGQRVDLSLTGGGTIAADAVDTAQLVVTVIGAGRLQVGGRAARARFLMNGPGAIEATALTADELTVRSEGAGVGRYTARYNADLTGLGAGSIEVAGEARCRTSGTATIRCGGAGSQPVR